MLLVGWWAVSSLDFVGLWGGCIIGIESGMLKKKNEFENGLNLELLEGMEKLCRMELDLSHQVGVLKKVCG